LEVMRALPEASVDAVVTDPPYAIGFMGKEWDSPGKAFVERKPDKRNTWDHVGGNHNPANAADQARTRRAEAQRFQAWCVEWVTECLRVLKPGGHLLAFGGTRTYHRLACAIEDAGFEIRDSLHWIYGSGFPKSLDVSKAIDKMAGVEREVLGHDVTQGHYDDSPRKPGRKLGRATYAQDAYSQEMSRVKAMTAPAAEDAVRWAGWGTALKPAHEPIVVARKPLAGIVAANVLEHGTGALNVDGCRVSTVDALVRPTILRTDNDVLGAGLGAGVQSEPAGRWPPNILLTHSAECDRDCAPDCPVAELDRQSGVNTNTRHMSYRRGGGEFIDSIKSQPEKDWFTSETGGASRFFPVFRYQAKAPSSERPRLPDGTAWPTVKPLALMRWLVRLVTPPGGTVLDPFAGTGTTGEACALEGFHCILIERDPTALALARQRFSRPRQDVLEAL